MQHFSSLKYQTDIYNRTYYKSYRTNLKYIPIMKGVHFILTLSVLALAVSIASAYDPSPLQDFCVATNDTKNACKFAIFLFQIALF